MITGPTLTHGTPLCGLQQQPPSHSAAGGSPGAGKGQHLPDKEKGSCDREPQLSYCCQLAWCLPHCRTTCSDVHLVECTPLPPRKSNASPWERIPLCPSPTCTLVAGVTCSLSPQPSCQAVGALPSTSFRNPPRGPRTGVSLLPPFSLCQTPVGKAG